MREVEREITKEEYDRIKNLSYREQHDAIWPKGVPAQLSMGYGYYGHRLSVHDGKCYAVYSIGSSCD